MATKLMLDPAALGPVKAWGCAPSFWDGEQRKDRATGHLLWDIECSTDLGRFAIRVAAPGSPMPVGEYDAGRPVRLVRLAVTGWGASGPYLHAASIELLKGSDG